LSVKELLQGGASDAELAEKLAEAKTEIEDLREQLEAAGQQIEDMNKEMLKLEASKKTLRESLKKSKEEAEQLGFEVKDLRRFKQIGEDADNLRQAFIKFLRLDDLVRNAAPGFEPGAAVPSEIVLEHEVPSFSLEIERPVLKVSEKTWQGRLLCLVADGFFDSPRKLGDVQRELDRMFASKGRSATISKELAALCPLRILQRKQEGGSWSYSVVSFAKERIEAIEVEALKA